jgi:hypothetical protein
VTWTERSSSPTTYTLRLTNLATLLETDINIAASGNLSSYTSRYDKFTISVGALNKGQYKYEVYQELASSAKVIETGLAFIETTEGTFTSTSNSIDYISYNL